MTVRWKTVDVKANDEKEKNEEKQSLLFVEQQLFSAQECVDVRVGVGSGGMIT